MKLLTSAVAVIVAAALVQLIGGQLTQPGPNAFIPLYLLANLAVPVAGLIGLYVLSNRPDLRPVLVASGLYALALGVTFATLTPIWGPTDNSFLGMALFAGLAAFIGAGLATAAAILVAGRSMGFALAGGVMAAVPAGVAALAGAAVGPAVPLCPQIVVAAVILLLSLFLVRRQLLALAPALFVAAVGAVLMVALIILRGPDDWATGSQSLKLYSFPIIVIALALPFVIEAVSRRSEGRRGSVG